jgi:gas vesicle protein GvpL/GvpF
MSETEQKQGEDGGYTGTRPEGYYVYCISERGPALEILTTGSTPSAMEENTHLEVIAEDDLAAIVSRVPLSVFGEEFLDAHLSDAPWVTVRAMRHEQVVEHFARNTSVVPLRFGTIYLDETGIKQMLADKEAQLRVILDRVKGHEEWGVNVYCDRTVLLENITNISPRLREMTATAKSALPGQSYLLQKKIEALRADEVKLEIERTAKRIEERLSSLSDGVSRLRVLNVETTEHGELRSKFAFLVAKTNFEDFRDAAEEIAREIESAGIRIELTGPWPAYNFAAA